MYRYIVIFIFFFSCGTEDQNLVVTDLLSHGEAIKVMAPEDAHIQVEDYGLIKDIIITDSLDYSLQIFISKTNTLSIAEAVNDQKKIVQDASFFSQFTEENEQGFIYEKKIDSLNLRYDFRYIKIQADKQYIFQPSLSGGHSEAHVRKMYGAVQQ